MPETTQDPIAGKEYRFLEDGFLCKEWDGPIRYEDIIKVTAEDGSLYVEFRFNNAKGKERGVSVILESSAQKSALMALLPRKIPNASVTTRSQTAWEAASAWVTLGVCLAALVGLIILFNTWGRGATVSVPIWMIPFLLIGSFLSTQVLIAIAAAILIISGVGAVLAQRKRKTVWTVSRG